MIWSDNTAAPVTVTVAEQGALLDDLGARFEAGQGFSVATLNLDHVVKLGRDPAFGKASCTRAANTSCLGAPSARKMSCAPLSPIA